MFTDSTRILQDGSSDDGSSDQGLHTCRYRYIAYCLFFQVQPYNRKYRSIGHRVWSMSLDILTELSVNSIVL